MNEYVLQPGNDVKLAVVHSEHMGDWWTIERAEHPNDRWMKPTQYGAALMYSGRISDACVEGTAYEMLELAHSIENNISESFKRCAVEVTEGGFLFSSPRNSQEPGWVSTARAKELAAEIRAKVKLPEKADE